MVTVKKFYRIAFPNGATMEFEDSNFYEFSDTVRRLERDGEEYKATVVTALLDISERPYVA